MKPNSSTVSSLIERLKSRGMLRRGDCWIDPPERECRFTSLNSLDIQKDLNLHKQIVRTLNLEYYLLSYS